MAYVSSETAKIIRDTKIGEISFESANELTYSILQLIQSYLNDNFNNYNEVVGAIEDAKQELFRTVIGPSNAQKKFDFEG